MKTLSLFLLAIFFWGCSVELAPPEKDSQFVPLVPTPTLSCDDCTKAKCAQYSECESSESCVALGACVRDCTTPSCQMDCRAQHPEAVELQFQLLSCSFQACPSECATPACSDCERSACGTKKTDCVGDANCLGALQCTALCQDDACDTECDAYWSNGGGVAKLDAYMGCSTTQCSGACQ